MSSNIPLAERMRPTSLDDFLGQEHLVGEVFAVCFCYQARPEVQQAIRDAGIRLVFSYGKLV